MSPAEFSTLTVQVTDGVATVRLDRPEHGNAIDTVMARELGELATRLAEDDTVRAIVLGGNGPMFNAGGDIGVFSSSPDLSATVGSMIDDIHPAVRRLTELDAPVVAAVSGAAGGGGLGLACMADIVVAAEDAIFAVGYSGIGLTGDCGISWFLPRLVGLRRAQEMFLLNRRLTAVEALEWGIVTKIVPTDEVDAEATRIAERIATGPTRAFGGMRRLLRQSFDTGLPGQLAAERAAMVSAAGTGDAAEGVAAFAERRRPRFSGR